MVAADVDQWQASRSRIRFAWTAAAVGIASLILVGTGAAYFYKQAWGPPLVMGATAGALLTIALLGTWSTRCVMRRVSQIV